MGDRIERLIHILGMTVGFDPMRKEEERALEIFREELKADNAISSPKQPEENSPKSST